MKGLFGLRTGGRDSCGDLGDCDVGVILGDKRGAVSMLEVATRLTAGGIMDCLAVTSSVLEWFRVFALPRDGDGSITRSSLPWSDHEKCVTVTGVVQRFCDNLLLSSVSTCEGSSACAPSGMAAQPTTVEFTPPRDKVSLSPPCDNVHIKQVSPTQWKQNKKQLEAKFKHIQAQSVSYICNNKKSVLTQIYMEHLMVNNLPFYILHTSDPY
jgi:hypothetical protein